MKTFAHFNASTTDEAVALLKRYGKNAQLIAGGTDLLGKMKDRILPKYPEALINLKTIPGLDAIQEENGQLKIGALAILEDIAHNPTVKKSYAALAEAARRTASPHLREMGTIGGNICQDIRCWYYRHPENRFPCLRKGGGKCYALEGDKRYHSVFGASVEEGCIAVHPSDTAAALIALNAKIKTTQRTVEADNFFQVDVSKTTVLADDQHEERILKDCLEKIHRFSNRQLCRHGNQRQKPGGKCPDLSQRRLCETVSGPQGGSLHHRQENRWSQCRASGASRHRGRKASGRQQLHGAAGQGHGQAGPYGLQVTACFSLGAVPGGPVQ
jgi:CO/xanthine dehydrogenase FAD-binding subunit